MNHWRQATSSKASVGLRRGRSWPRTTEHLFKMDRRADHGCLNPLFDGTADTHLIREQWDFLVRVAASLKNRTAPANVIVQRLANASSSDRLAGALTALGRVVKTIFILRYLSDSDLRHHVQLQLNRGEARHELAGRCLFFANRGEFRSGDAEEIMNKASCLSLLSNAVLVWNTLRNYGDREPTADGRPRNRGPGPRTGVAAHAWACDTKRHLSFL